MKRKSDSLPKWGQQYLRAICPHELLEEIEGDLIQQYHRKIKRSGVRKASLNLMFSIIRYGRPGIFLRKKSTKLRFNGAMINSYFITSYRHVLKDKINSFFKVAGLTLALFSLLVVGLYLSYQLSFDRYHDGYERIYRVNTQRTENGNVEQYGIAPVALGPMLKDNFPEIESFARFDISNGAHLHYQQKVIFGGVFGIDSTWFNVFSYQFIKGSSDALSRPSTIVLTETLANKIFGEEDPLHKTLTINNEKTLYEVTGVIRDIPHNSHLRVEAFIPINRTQHFNAQQIISPVEFVDNSIVLFVKLRADASPRRLVAHLEELLDQYVPEKQRHELGFRVFLQPLKDIYLDPPLKYEFTRKGSMTQMYVFALLGLFLIIIACINYSNLSLAGFVNRSREMGVRKVLGGRKSQIMVQIALDTVSYGVISLLASVLLLYLMFPKIQEYVEPQLQFVMIATPTFVLIFSLILLLVIILSTVMPAVWFATNSTSNDLKGFIFQEGRVNFNNSLLSVQFVLSIICIGATLTIGNQINFIHQKDLGINRKNLLVLSMSEDFSVNKMKALKASLKTIPGVTHISNSSFRMGGGYWKDWYQVEIDQEMKSFELYEVFSDDELFETLGMKVLQGRVFDAGHKADSGAAFVINETAAHELGLKDPVGTRILTHPEDPGKWEGTIVGVVNDINIGSLHQSVKPLVMRLPWQTNYPEYFVYVRYEGNPTAVIRSIKQRYNELQPGYPLEVHFVDDFYNHQYEKESRAFASMKFGTGIILMISALGIFSLSIYLSLRKMKEFGIRKVLGASARQIAYLHIWHFVRIAFFAITVALPVTYFLMNEWLKSFAYRVSPDIGTALIVVTVTLSLIVLSAGYAALRAGLMNPLNVINRV